MFCGRFADEFRTGHRKIACSRIEDRAAAATGLSSSYLRKLKRRDIELDDYVKMCRDEGNERLASTIAEPDNEESMPSPQCSWTEEILLDGPCSSTMGDNILLPTKRMRRPPGERTRQPSGRVVKQTPKAQQQQQKQEQQRQKRQHQQQRPKQQIQPIPPLQQQPPPIPPLQQQPPPIPPLQQLPPQLLPFQEHQHRQQQQQQQQPQQEPQQQDEQHHRARGKPLIDEFTFAAIRNVIYEFFEAKRYFTTKSLNEELKQRGICDVSQTTLWRALKKGGFRYKGKGRNKYLLEKPHIVASRHRFLRDINDARKEGKILIYLDETWCNQNHQHKFLWKDKDGRSFNFSEGKGGRWIMVDAGHKDGFIPGATLLFRSISTKDYHEEMDAERFEKWIQDQLLPNLPPNCAVIMDNAPYHTRVTDDTRSPTTSWKKGDVQQWLESQDINFHENMLKVELMEIVKRHKIEKKYVVDRMLTSAGHRVIRLPPYHCNFNPIELIWAYEKRYVADHNKENNMSKTKQLLLDARENIPQSLWSNSCDHVIKEEKLYWERDGLLETRIEPVVINLSSSDSDDSDTETDEISSLDSQSDVETDTRRDAEAAARIVNEKECCTICGSATGEDPEWVGCDRAKCQLWYHMRCLKVEEVALAQQSMHNRSKWLCPLCKSQASKYTKSK